METSTSQLSGQVGGVQGSVQTGHPAVVTDDFHQGAYESTWKTYMKTLPLADIYLAAATLSRMREDRRD